MKVTFIKTNPAIVIILLLLAVSCVKQRTKEIALEQIDYSNKSFVQVYNATLLSARNYVYVDGQPVNGASLAYGATFPSTPANFAVTSGFRAFLIRDTLSTTLQLPLSFAEDFKAASNFTIFMYDTITSPKQKTVQNNIVIPSDTTARLRFANFIYSPIAIPSAFDIFSVKRNANIFSNVQLTEVTDFIPYDSRVTDTFYIRPAGSTTNLQNFNPSPAPGAAVNIQAVLTPTRLRSYTLIFRGGYRATATTNTTVRTLSVFANN